MNGMFSPMTGDSASKNARGEEPPPLFGAWSRLYAAVLACLFLLILLFYIFTKTFRGD